MSISGNLVGSYSQLGKTFVLTDENGTELTGVVVGQETIFTAHDNDVRLGSVYAGDEGVSTGTKVIPSYNTTEGTKVITAGSAVTLPMKDDTDYTKMQAIVCAYNTSLSNSVCAEKVVINDNVYAVQSTEVLSAVIKDTENNLINFGITNTSDSLQIVRYFMYKEIY